MLSQTLFYSGKSVEKMRCKDLVRNYLSLKKENEKGVVAYAVC